MRGTVAIDFDGVLHGYSKGWQNGDIYDPPIDGSAEACWFLSKMYKLVVVTARQETDAVSRWLRQWGFPPMQVTNTKIPAIAYIDDRGIRFENWRQALLDLDRLIPVTR